MIKGSAKECHSMLEGGQAKTDSSHTNPLFMAVINKNHL